MENENIKKSKNDNILLCGALTFLPIVVYVTLIVISGIIMVKSFNNSLCVLLLILNDTLFVFISLLTFIKNIKLNNKVLKILFTVISIICIIVGLLGLVSEVKTYNYSKKSDQIVNDFIKNADNRVSSYIKTCKYCYYNTGDIIYPSDIKISTKKLDDNNLYCNWYTKILDKDKNKVKTYTGCWSVSDKYIYYFKSENFNNDLLEN